MTPWETLFRLFVSAILGGLVGFDRSMADKAAGIRTHMLVSLGSCLVMIISMYGFDEVLTERRVAFDPSRVASLVVSGIGFLGAGMILRRSEAVYGLTTAASTWAVSAVGLATGGGLYVAAGGSTALILLVLTVVRSLETRLVAWPAHRRLTIDAEPGGLDPSEIAGFLDGTEMELRGMTVRRLDRANLRIAVNIGHASDDALLTLVGRLAAHQGVREVSYESPTHG